MSRAKIAVVTSIRSDYGLLRPLIRLLHESKNFELALVVSGAHLSEKFGRTISEIESDGFPIAAKVPFPVEDDADLGIATSSAFALKAYAESLSQLKPDLVVVLGDRFEILSAAFAATMLKIPIAHLSGGEVTLGAIDEVLRHGLTKLSHLHFATSETYRRRIIQMGEEPHRVFNAGLFCIDQINAVKRISRDEFFKSLGLSPLESLLLVTYHPATLGKMKPAEAIGELISALERIDSVAILVTMPNTDAGSASIRNAWLKFAEKNPAKVRAVESLGQKRYLSAIEHSVAVVGNSSSGLTEVPLFGIPTVNIGDRQKGRARPASVIDCQESSGAIFSAISRALSAGFQEQCRQGRVDISELSPAKKVFEELSNMKLSDLIPKTFFDLDS